MTDKNTFIPRPEHARVPQALPAFLLRPDQPPVYRWWRRVLDRWAGVRDRTPAPEHREGATPVADSPWLRRLLAECAAAIAVGRTRTDALVAVLDVECARVRAEIEVLEGVLDELDEARSAADQETIDDTIVGPGELYSPPEERLQRRARQKADKIARLQAQADAVQARLRSARQELGVLEQERRSHWSVLQERTRLLVEHYQRRAGSYTRGLERRRRRVFFVTPTVVAPDWVRADLGTGGIDTAPVLNLLPNA